jgi:hypothetical protein
MEIGGTDVVIDGEGAPGESLFIVSCLCAHWEDLVVQDAEADSTVSARDPAIGAMREFFVYRDPESFDSWSKNGATPDNMGAMIHVLLGDRTTTFVADGAQVEVVRALGRTVIARRESLCGRRMV